MNSPQIYFQLYRVRMFYSWCLTGFKGVVDNFLDFICKFPNHFGWRDAKCSEDVLSRIHVRISLGDDWGNFMEVRDLVCVSLVFLSQQRQAEVPKSFTSLELRWKIGNWICVDYISSIVGWFPEGVLVSFTLEKVRMTFGFCLKLSFMKGCTITVRTSNLN